MLFAVVAVDTTPPPAADTLHASDIVVTASRFGQDRREAPVLVSTTDTRVINAVQAISVSEGLSFQPGLRVEQDCQNCGFTQVRLNGLQGPYTQILIDSRPVFSSLNGVYGLEQIPSGMIDRIEVTRGGGSAMFGAGAIAGTINIITKEPIGTTIGVKATPSLIGGRAQDFNLSGSASAVTDNYLTGVTLFGSSRNREWYDRNGDDYSELVKLNSAAGGLRAYHYFSEDDRLSAEGHWIREFRRGGEMVDALPEETAITEQLDHSIGGGALSYETAFNNKDTRMSAYASGQHTTRHSYYGGNGGDTSLTELAKTYYGETTDAIGVMGIQFSHIAREFAGNDLVIVSGIEGAYNDVSDNLPGYGRQIDQTTTDLGAYVQGQYAPGSPLSVALGARLDVLNIDGTYQYDGNIAEPTKRDFFVVNPRISIISRPTEIIQVRLGYATGFRGPQAFDEDFHLSTLSGAARLIQINPDLQPERSHSLNASFNIDDRSISSAEGLTIEGFATLLNDPFVVSLTADTTNAGGSVAVKHNGDDAWVAGINAEYRLAFSGTLELLATGTFQTTRYTAPQVVATGIRDGVEVDITTETFLRTPNIYGSFVTSFTPWETWSFDLNMILTGPMTALNERTLISRTTPWFAEVGARVGYHMHVGNSIELKAGLGIINILDVYQNDLDSGPTRDANYIYGPFRPRTITFTFSIGVE